MEALLFPQAQSDSLPQSPQRIQVSLEDLYLLLGERMVVIYKLEQQIKQFLTQSDQMAAEITRLRTDNEKLSQQVIDLREINGELVQPAHNHPV
jgi:FtsZ-binding cell division protein ZapB